MVNQQGRINLISDWFKIYFIEK